MRAFPWLLVILVLASPLLADNWREYSFPEDGFAATLPYKPVPHPAVVVPNATAYLVELPGDVRVALRVSHPSEAVRRNCPNALLQLRSKMMTSDTTEPRVERSSVRQIEIDGYPGMQWTELWAHGTRADLQRTYCVNDRMYVFSASAPAGKPFPADAKRILDSVRLLASQQ